MKKSIFGCVIAASLIVSSAFAAEKSAPLPSGKPAGTKQAQLQGLPTPLIAVAVGTAVFVALAATGAFNDDSSAITTGTP